MKIEPIMSLISTLPETMRHGVNRVLEIRPMLEVSCPTQP